MVRLNPRGPYEYGTVVLYPGVFLIRQHLARVHFGGTEAGCAELQAEGSRQGNGAATTS